MFKAWTRFEPIAFLLLEANALGQDYQRMCAKEEEKNSKRFIRVKDNNNKNKNVFWSKPLINIFVNNKFRLKGISVHTY